MQVIYLDKVISDDDIKEKEGEYFDESHYTIIINNDCDVYGENNKLLAKFRKNVIDKQLCKDACNSYRKVSKAKRNNRGVASGVIDENKLSAAHKDRLMHKKGKFRISVLLKNGQVSKSHYANKAASNIIGYYDKAIRQLHIPGDTKPCRLTSFNENYPELFKKSLPFLNRVDELFKELVPEAHAKQLERARKTSEFQIEDTAFSTVTLNYSWRTANHQDVGDYKEGFGNLLVLEDEENPNTYEGCYTGFPQYGVAFNIREGDFLAMDVHEFHCNTQFKPTTEPIGKITEQDLINNWYLNRLSVVCYLREGMVKCAKENQLSYKLKSLRM